jgi:hypothetical protein
MNQTLVSIKKLEQDSFLFLTAIGKWDFNLKLGTDIKECLENVS